MNCDNIFNSCGEKFHQFCQPTHKDHRRMTVKPMPRVFSFNGLKLPDPDADQQCS
jgi:hypothetical protein